MINMQCDVLIYNNMRKSECYDITTTTFPVQSIPKIPGTTTYHGKSKASKSKHVC